MRLIDADLLEPDAEYDDGEFWAVSMRQIENAPTIEPKKGKWIKDRDNIYYCSCCGTDYLMYDFAVEDTHYCPNCGADMKEGD